VDLPYLFTKSSLLNFKVEELSNCSSESFLFLMIFVVAGVLIEPELAETLTVSPGAPNALNASGVDHSFAIETSQKLLKLNKIEIRETDNLKFIL